MFVEAEVEIDSSNTSSYEPIFQPISDFSL